MNELALFAGAGGGILGGKLLGWRTVCAVEYEPYPASVLMQRQNEGFLKAFPIWDDVRTFDGKPWKGLVDVVSGGFPCQDISSAGNGAGLEGAKSSMWFEMLRIIQEVKPEYVFIENSPNLRTRGLVTVLQGLAESGYNAAWGVLSAEDCGANHQRKRMWIVGKLANSKKLLGNGKFNYSRCSLEPKEKSKPRDCSRTEDVPNANSSRWKDCNQYSSTEETNNVSALCSGSSGGWYKIEPDVGRVVDGVAFRVDRLKAIGNGQVPIVAATAFLQLKAKLDELEDEH